MKNMEIATLRSLVTIAEEGSMTRAAAKLHLTQSAISMQIKRLEEGLSMKAFDRYSHGMAPTANGEQLIHYAQQMLSLNDEVLGRLTGSQFEGQLSLGVPSDIIEPYIPEILKAFVRDYPRVQVKLVTNNTLTLLKDYHDGKHDLVLTTERQPGKGGEVLSTHQLEWKGALGGRAWKTPRLPIALCQNCIFRKSVAETLSREGFSWENSVISNDDLAVNVTISADMGITVGLPWANETTMESIDHKGYLPELPESSIVLYGDEAASSVYGNAFINLIRRTYI